MFTAIVEVRPRLTLEEGVQGDPRRATRGRDHRRGRRPISRLAPRPVRRARDRVRPARSGDYVVDRPAGGRARRGDPGGPGPTTCAVGSGEFGDKLDAELVGKRAGEILAFNDTLGPGAGIGRRGGGLPRLVKEVKGKLPEADDEFAKVASEFDTIDELRANSASSWAAAGSAPPTPTFATACSTR